MDNTPLELEALHALGLRNKLRRAPRILECYWTAPSPKYLKINADGCARGNPGSAGWGTLFRKHIGEVVGVYIGGIGSYTNYVAESKAIVEGWGTLFKKHTGEVIGVYGGIGSYTNYVAESKAIVEGIIKAIEMGFTKIWPQQLKHSKLAQCTRKLEQIGKGLKGMQI
ncbi:hypothetical protein IFM89_019420 [Coptis chinensis]|uniref:RNase H type-1 domain-containing protein n=1 Tax=Coptis chinensis TaxID=261450 RepID=A0A835IPX3_9MAGN|nr:hypothetical protein IFM89_019420 [Coptis chinensis]